MATMTFQYDRYYRFKVISLENINKIGDPHFLFYSIISFGILNHFHNLKKKLSCQHFDRIKKKS
jgi:hypothetical protein